MNRTQKRLSSHGRCKYSLHTTASSVAEEIMETKETTQTGKNREAGIDTCEKHGHLTDKTGGGKHWKMADMQLIICGCYKTSQSVPLLAP